MKNQRIRLGLVGSTGRMGKIVQQAVQDEGSADFRLVFTCSGPRDPAFRLLERERPQLLIDFSSPECSLAVAKQAAALKIPMLVCTTGFTPVQMKKLEKTLNPVAWAWVPNTSIGVFALNRALEAALKTLPADAAVSILDVHHSAKKDAPSGTAIALRSTIERVSKAKVEILSTRGGTEVGEHRVLILLKGEKLEFTHQAGDRSLFAYGALRLGKALLERKPAGRAYTGAELFS